MWMILGAIAIIAGLLNVILTFQKKDVKWFRFTSLSFTALTLCTFYSINATWVANEDWSALMDVTPTMSKVLWISTIASILINSVSLWKQRKR
ncbi:MAG: hypothetical protein PHS74_02180 [Lachnospiraceae bacterium]|nr:hypothetical protein [Lachnospiraceae bacterium]